MVLFVETPKTRVVDLICGNNKITIKIALMKIEPQVNYFTSYLFDSTNNHLKLKTLSTNSN